MRLLLTCFSPGWEGMYQMAVEVLSQALGPSDPGLPVHQHPRFIGGTQPEAGLLLTGYEIHPHMVSTGLSPAWWKPQAPGKGKAGVEGLQFSYGHTEWCLLIPLCLSQGEGDCVPMHLGISPNTYTHVYKYLYMHICLYMHKYTRVHICVMLPTNAYLCTGMYMNAHTYV